MLNYASRRGVKSAGCVIKAVDLSLQAGYLTMGLIPEGLGTEATS